MHRNPAALSFRRVRDLRGDEAMPDLGTCCIENWPLTSRESARRIIDQYGEPDEVTDNQLIWHKRGPWRQIVASKILYQHNFPAPHYALFELEPAEATEQKPQRTRPAAKVKLQGKTKLKSKPAHEKDHDGFGAMTLAR